MSNENFENFSVLMSLYDKENVTYLDKCFRSIYAQKIHPDEVVVVYDGYVNDGLNSIVEKWKAFLNIIIVSSPINVGLGPALNLGLKSCSNNLVFRMDTDDICAVNRFEKQLEKFKKEPHLKLLGGAIEEFEHDVCNVKTQKNVPIGARQIAEYAVKRNPFNHMTVAFKKDFIESVGGYEEHQHMEDYNLWLRVIRVGPVYDNLSDTLVYARVGNGFIGRRRGWSYIKSEFQMMFLKLHLGYKPIFSILTYGLFRCFLRILPSMMVEKLYVKIRRGDG